MNTSLLLATAAIIALNLRSATIQQEERQHRSTLERLAPTGQSTDAVRWVEITVPGTIVPTGNERGEMKVPGTIFSRDEMGWRIPAYRNAFARSSAIHGLLHAFVEARGTRVGRWPEDAARFGFEQRLSLRCFGADGRLIVAGVAGGVVPGPRRDECYFANVDRPDILQLAANPWPLFEGHTATGLPPLIDRRITPEALARRGIVRVEFDDPSAPQMRALQRRDLPPVPGFQQDRGPRFAWTLELQGVQSRPVDEHMAMSFVHAITTAEWMQLLDGQEASKPFVPPFRTVTLRHDGDAVDVLQIQEDPAGNRILLHHQTTGQRFVIDEATRHAYTPDPARW